MPLFFRRTAAQKSWLRALEALLCKVFQGIPFHWMRAGSSVGHSPHPAIFERMESTVKISQNDIGSELQGQVDDLKALLRAYKMGEVKEDHKG